MTIHTCKYLHRGVQQKTGGTSEARGRGRDGSCDRNDETDEDSETYPHDQHHSNASETPALLNQSCALKNPTTTSNIKPQIQQLMCANTTLLE